jgi:hypothetical protein
MKTSEILGETPYLHRGEMSRKMLDDGISLAAIKREYRKLGEVQDLVIYIDHHDSHVISLDLSAEVKNERFQQVFRIQFKESTLLQFENNFKNCIQIDKVAVLRAAGTQGIATKVYKMLVDHGYTVISDITQFDPARALWKKLATDSEYKVYVADIGYGIFKDQNGKDIVYNGENIADQDIWTEGSDFTGQYRVLILTK